jgi:hypothetical protein
VAWLWNIQGVVAPVLFELAGNATFAQNRTMWVRPIGEYRDG